MGKAKFACTCFDDIKVRHPEEWQCLSYARGEMVKVRNEYDDLEQRHFKTIEELEKIKKHFGVIDGFTTFQKCICGSPVMTNESRSGVFCIQCVSQRVPVLIEHRDQLIEANRKLREALNKVTSGDPKYALAT